MATETVRRRLHVSGLTPQITSAHLKDRFSIFGQVSDVEDLGMNAVGQHRPFTYLTIETTPTQLQKCLNIMSGSTWRGARLLIAPAKPSYTARLEKERNPSAEEARRKAEKRRKRKRLEMGDEVGREVQDMRLVTAKNCTTKKHWMKMDDGRLVRPMAMRPSHPLPALDSAKEATKKRISVRRARRRVINPTLWDPSHLGEGSFPQSSVSVTTDSWEYEELDEEEEQETEGEEGDGKVAIGVWRNGEEEQVVRVRMPKTAAVVDGEAVSDAEEEEEDGEDASWDGESQAETSSDLFGHRPDRDRSDSPLLSSSRNMALPGEEKDAMDDNLDAEKMVSFGESPEGADSPLFPSHPAEDESDSVNAEHPDSSDGEPSRSASPLFPPQSPNLDDPSEESQSTTALDRPALPDDIRNLAKAERSQNVSLLSSFLAKDATSPPAPSEPSTKNTKRNEWAGFSESDSEDDTPAVEGIPLRLRGGAGPEWSGASSNEDSDNSDDSSEESSDSDSDSDEDDSDDSSDPDPPPKANANKEAAPTKPRGGLKDMFAPTSSTSAAGGFSLAALGADMDIDETMDLPTSFAPSGAQETALEPLPMTTSKKALFEVDQGMSLFFPVSLISTGPTYGGGKTNDPAASYVALEHGSLPAESNGTTGEAGVPREEGFWAHETDAEMRQIWTADKYGLTKGWKRRGREGRKQKRRRGGDDDD